MLTGHVRCVSRWLILHAIAMLLTDYKAIVVPKNYLRVKQIQILFKNGEMLTLPNSPEAADTISSSFRQGEVESIHSTEPDLETVFMKLTGRSLVKG